MGELLFTWLKNCNSREALLLAVAASPQSVGANTDMDALEQFIYILQWVMTWSHSCSLIMLVEDTPMVINVPIPYQLMLLISHTLNCLGKLVSRLQR